MIPIGADSEVQVLNNTDRCILEIQATIHSVNPAIKELQNKITREMAGIKDEYQEHYVAGLSDALGIIMKHLSKQLTVGSEYYVVMPKDDITNQVVKMRLYKITQKRKFYFSFTSSNAQSKYPTNDLTLSNPNSIQMRIFDSEEEAEKNKGIMIWRRELRKEWWGG